MQDLAGCRIVVEGLSLQDEVTERLAQLFPQAKVKDRRQRPSHGYRAVHLIAPVQGRQVEVQVRTSLQEAWAGAVESLVTFWVWTSSTARKSRVSRGWKRCSSRPTTWRRLSERSVASKDSASPAGGV